MKKYTIRDREAGNTIEDGLILHYAVERIKEFEEIDKKEGTYTPNFYELMEEEANHD